MHTHIAADLRELYPMWEKFQEVRRRLDPKGRFMNPYLAKIFHGPREMP
jgi:L-gulonolactone oxidase